MFSESVLSHCLELNDSKTEAILFSPPSPTNIFIELLVHLSRYVDAVIKNLGALISLTFNN